eukprot:1149239-Pelagomonas_calceolata.AAC.3
MQPQHTLLGRHRQTVSRSPKVACKAIEADAATRVRGHTAAVYKYFVNPANFPAYRPGMRGACPRDMISVCEIESAARNFSHTRKWAEWHQEWKMLIGKGLPRDLLEREGAVQESRILKGYGPDVRSQWQDNQSIGRMQVDVT